MAVAAGPSGGRMNKTFTLFCASCTRKDGDLLPLIDTLTTCVCVDVCGSNADDTDEIVHAWCIHWCPCATGAITATE